MLRCWLISAVLLAPATTSAAETPRAFRPTGRVDALAAVEAARPLVTTRPIFAPAAPLGGPPAFGGMARPTALPSHRVLPVAPPTKSAGGRASGGSTPAATPSIGPTGAPMHRRGLGW